jgi:SAM-dependent methyltransferase
MQGHLLPAILEMTGTIPTGTRILDVGCGNGWLAGALSDRGYEVIGIDMSDSGIRIARRSHPGVRFEVLPANDGILDALQVAPFDIIVSTEVVEHLYAPRSYASACFAALRSGGRFVCSTPYHGYLKNLALALANRWDSHADPLWDGGHIKLWSRRTLSALLSEAGFVNLRFCGAGRCPWLWMTMVLGGDKP